MLFAAAAAAKSLQSCPILCDPIDSSPPGSPVLGILQARTLEWVAISFCNAWKWKVKGKSLSRVRLFVTPWTAAYQAPSSMGFSRQEYWNGVPLPSLEILFTKCQIVYDVLNSISFSYFPTSTGLEACKLYLWDALPSSVMSDMTECWREYEYIYVEDCIILLYSRN